MPEDLQKFVTLAHSSYKNAAKPTWTTKMTKRNYAPARLTTLGAALDTLAGTESEQRRRRGRSAAGYAGAERGLRRAEGVD